MGTLREQHGFFDSIDAAGSDPGDIRMYNSEEFSIPWRYYMTNGVLEFNENLQVAPGDDSLTTVVRPGFAMIEGRHYVMDYHGEPSPEDKGVVLAHIPAVSANRIDRVVLRLNLEQTNEGRFIKPMVKPGVEGGGPPALTRDANVYELSLAQVLIRPGTTIIPASDILDERPDAAVCGKINKKGDEEPFVPEAKNVTLAPIPGLSATNVQAGLVEMQGAKVDGTRKGWSGIISVNHPTIEFFELDVEESAAWGLPDGSWHRVMYFPNRNADGYGMLHAWAVGNPETMWMRPSASTAWGAWRRVDASTLRSTNPVTGVEDTIQGSFNALFTLANDGKSAVVGAANEKGVTPPASASDTFPVLADKIRSIQLGALTVDEYVILTSGNWTAPAGAFRVRACLVSGGGSGMVFTQSGGPYSLDMGAGFGGNILVVDEAVYPGQPIYCEIGAGGPHPPDYGAEYIPGNPGGTTRFGGHSVPGGSGGLIDGTKPSPVFKHLWNDSAGSLICGTPELFDYNAPNSPVPNSLLAGGGFVFKASTDLYSNSHKAPVPGYGGGGLARANNSGVTHTVNSGSSGRIQIQVYRR